MFTKFKSALYSAVGNFEVNGRALENNESLVEQGSEATNSLGQPKIKRRTGSCPYKRPSFLQLNSDDEILVTADHNLRPIICPRDINKMPWNSGYAETINAGKSKRNEDQSTIMTDFLTRSVQYKIKKSRTSESNKSLLTDNFSVSSNCESNTPCSPTENANKNFNRLRDDDDQNVFETIVTLPYHYFAVFDGHAGWGAAVSASSQLHNILHEKLCEVVELIIPNQSIGEELPKHVHWWMDRTISPDNAVMGALEKAFWTMDEIMKEESQRGQTQLGGCTACIALFILGKVFVANAGDSRATIACNSAPVPMSFDFTPETESQRVRKLGARYPEFLGSEFTHLEFLRRPLKSDLGKKAAYREHYMNGWALKTITEADLKYPLISGEGKRSRVLATIGVTRGFGDHDLKAQFSGLPIKPFLTPEPEVCIFDLQVNSVDENDVLILATDGLWDILSNEKAVKIVSNSLQQFPLSDLHRYKYRYTSASHDLVLHARGRYKDHNWRNFEERHATIDDISVFVIPLNMYNKEYEKWSCDIENRLRSIQDDFRNIMENGVSQQQNNIDEGSRSEHVQNGDSGSVEEVRNESIEKEIQNGSPENSQSMEKEIKNKSLETSRNTNGVGEQLTSKITDESQNKNAEEKKSKKKTSKRAGKLLKNESKDVQLQKFTEYIKDVTKTEVNPLDNLQNIKQNSQTIKDNSNIIEEKIKSLKIILQNKENKIQDIKVKMNKLGSNNVDCSDLVDKNSSNLASKNCSDSVIDHFSNPVNECEKDCSDSLHSCSYVTESCSDIVNKNSSVLIDKCSDSINKCSNSVNNCSQPNDNYSNSVDSCLKFEDNLSGPTDNCSNFSQICPASIDNYSDSIKNNSSNSNNSKCLDLTDNNCSNSIDSCTDQDDKNSSDHIDNNCSDLMDKSRSDLIDNNCSDLIDKNRSDLIDKNSPYHTDNNSTDPIDKNSLNDDAHIH